MDLHFNLIFKSSYFDYFFLDWYFFLTRMSNMCLVRLLFIWNLLVHWSSHNFHLIDEITILRFKMDSYRMFCNAKMWATLACNHSFDLWCIIDFDYLRICIYAYYPSSFLGRIFVDIKYPPNTLSISFACFTCKVQLWCKALVDELHLLMFSWCHRILSYKFNYVTTKLDIKFNQ